MIETGKPITIKASPAYLLLLKSTSCRFSFKNAVADFFTGYLDECLAFDSGISPDRFIGSILQYGNQPSYVCISIPPKRCVSAIHLTPETKQI